jgi:GNAT superfamily N-acetyltransferase
MEATGALPHASVWTTTDRDASAIWKPPGRWRVGGRELVKQMPQAVSSLRLGLPRALAVLATIEKKHPTEPHWYLAVLGTEPAAQGKGRGSAVIRPVLDRCDADGIPAYLESSKEANIPFYERHGFRVTEEVGFPRGGPSVWLMWREPVQR